MELQFEEENKDNNQKYEIKVEERVKKVTSLLQILAKAAEFAKNSRSWIQLENIIRYAWNILSYDLTSPLELKETEGWKYIFILSECSLYLLEYLRAGGNFRKVAGANIDEVKNQKPRLVKEPGKTVAFMIETEEEFNLKHNPNEQSTHTLATSKSGQVGIGGKGLKWFEKVGGFEISIHASFIGFAIQSLMGVKKWESLVDLSNRTNIATENLYASYLLPFIIYAQTTLFDDAAKKTKDKKQELVVREQQFENWKLANKKKLSLAKVAKEVTQEEQDFNKDKATLEKEINRLDIIEKVLRSDKDASVTLLENIKRDANNCEESLKECRKKYFQFGIHTQNFRLQELKKGVTHFDTKSKKKSL